ncbi:MAG: hypothetical protein IJK24_02875 [Oscillospiraceae bacterium]|nr:hypothetical protein [Oscillospiraceae bacterium]
MEFLSLGILNPGDRPNVMVNCPIADVGGGGGWGYCGCYAFSGCYWAK